VKQRIQKLRAHFKVLGVDAVLVSQPSDLRYLTGFPNADAWLLVSGKRSFYITDFRYTAEARKAIRDIEIVQFSSSIFETTVELLKDAGVRSLGIDDKHLTCYQYDRLKTKAGRSLRLASSQDTLQAIRSIKEPEEIQEIRKAIGLNLEAYRYIRPFIRPGVSERGILLGLERFVRMKNARFSFEPIIASGPNSSYPHAKVTDRKIRRNEPVLIDLGIEVNGYKSDLTRIFFLGKMARSFEKILSLVGQAQEEAFKVIRPGIPASQVDAAARGFLEKHDLAKHFGHSLGHGVGLDIHEAPRITGKSGALLSEGMVITIEPGVYLKRFGVRLEEMVLVTKNGCEVLSGDFHY
jgi:Xaa-Pro aminopeptidase